MSHNFQALESRQLPIMINEDSWGTSFRSLWASNVLTKMGFLSGLHSSLLSLSYEWVI